MYLPDSNVFIAALKGEPAVMDRFSKLAPHAVRLSALVHAELLFGARNSARVEENLILLDKMCSTFEILPFDAEAAHHCSIHRAILKRAGTPIGTMDLLIASSALAHNLTIVTRNTREFERIQGLKLEAW